MANPCFWCSYDGNPAESFQVLLPRVSRVESVDEVEAEDGITGNLVRVRTYVGTRRRIRITIERVSMLTSAGRGYFRALQAVLEHLRGGGWVAFAIDSDLVWAAYPSGVVWSQGASFLSTGGNAFSAYGGTASIEGEEIVIEDKPIYAACEWNVCTALTGAGTQVSLQTNTVRGYTSPGLVRNSGFWPKLVMPQDALARSNLLNEHGINWTLDWTLEVDPSIYTPAGG